MPPSRSPKKKFRKIFLVGDRRKGAVRPLVKKLEPFLRDQATVTGSDFSGTRKLDKIRADLVLVFGGDGSILSAARRMGSRQIPTLGVNLGRLGFLASVTPATAEKAIGSVLGGKFTIEKRFMLRCQVTRGRKKVFESLALNDAVLNRRSISRMIGVEISLGKRQVIDYRCDGVVVATPTGATGYSLSAGGPILDPELPAVTVTPLSPHTMTNRPLVVPANRILRLGLSEGAGKSVFLVDGQEWCFVYPGDQMEIRAARETFKLVNPHGSGFYQRMHTRLGWRGKMEGA